MMGVRNALIYGAFVLLGAAFYCGVVVSIESFGLMLAAAAAVAILAERVDYVAAARWHREAAELDDAFDTVPRHDDDGFDAGVVRLSEFRGCWPHEAGAPE